MQVYVSRHKALIGIAAILSTLALAFALFKATRPSLEKAIEQTSGREAAQAGVEAFYSVDYRTGQEAWSSGLCALASQPACDFYRNTVAPSLWPGFTTSQTVVQAKGGEAKLLSERLPTAQGQEPEQVWQVMVDLTSSWPQGDGQTRFPAYVLVVKETEGWKFERFLIPEELAKYTSGGK